MAQFRRGMVGHTLLPIPVVAVDLLLHHDCDIPAAGALTHPLLQPRPQERRGQHLGGHGAGKLNANKVEQQEVLR
jgi:hypothetical protein